VSTPELSVVCKSCGSEVSPYVTECPYCGTRIRKRAPKLERRGDELAARQSRRRKVRKRLPSLAISGGRSYATMALILAPALLVLVIRATDQPLVDYGALIGPVGDEWWRYLTSPFVYDDLGYLFVVGVGIAIFGAALEERLGTIATLLLALACGGLGMLAADGIESSLGQEGNIVVAIGGNGIALGLLGAWAMIRLAEVRAHPDDDVEVIGAAIAAVVLVALPVVDDGANVFAGVVGGLVGVAAGFAAGRVRTRSRAG
jgi:membrane associated rhomboid family serine protease